MFHNFVLSRIYLILLLIFVFAFSIRLSVLFLNYEIVYRGDDVQYLRLGSDLSKNKGFVDYKTGLPYAYWPPGWPIVISLIYRLFGHAELPLRIYQAFASSLLCVGVFLLGNIVCDKRIGLLAAFFCMLYPALLSQIGFNNLLNDPTYHLMLVGGLIFYFAGENIRYSYFFGGLILGFNSLVKPDGLIVLVILLALHIIQFGFRKVVIRRIFLISLGFMTAVLPWTARNYMLLKELVIVSTNSGVNLYVGNAPTFKNQLRQGDAFYDMIRAQGDGYEQGQVLNRRGLRYFVENLNHRPEIFIRKLKYHFDPFLPYKIKIGNIVETETRYNWMYVFLVPFIIGGFLTRATNKFVILSTMFLLINTLTALVYLGSVRYRLAIEPLLIIVGCIGLTSFANHSPFRLKLVLLWLSINLIIGNLFPREFPQLLMGLVPGSDPI